jgi:KDO2-lipid IV(A) lauroyltransferase
VKRLGQALVAALVGVFGLVARALPYSRALAWGRALGRAALALGVRRSVVLDNLARAYPEWSAVQVRDTARRTYEIWGQVFVDLLRAPDLRQADTREKIFASIEGLENVPGARARGRGVILLSGHFGVFELFGAAVAASGQPVDFLIQAQSNPWVDRWLEEARTRLGVGLIRRGAESRDLLRALRSNRCIALVADQDARERGVFVDFMGRPASTPIGPAALSLRTGAPIVMGFVVRGPDGRHRATFEPAIRFEPSGNEEQDVLDLTRRHVGVLESWVRRYPEHWYWFHRRWKTAPPALILTAALTLLGASALHAAAPHGRGTAAAADTARADEPTVFGGAGTSLLPLSETRVARVLEDVLLARRDDRWTIDVSDLWFGGGAPEVVRVGLPDFESVPDSGASKPTLEDVRLVVDGVELTPSLEPGPAHPNLPGMGGIGRFYVWQVPFAAEEWKLGRVTYRLHASRTQGGEELLFYYLNPGTPWRGASGRVNARFDLGDESAEDLVPGWLRPASFVIQGSAVVWRLATEEPEEDLVLATRAFHDPRGAFPGADGSLTLSPLERDEWLGRGTPREWRFWKDFLRVRRGEAAKDASFAMLLGPPKSKKPRRATKPEAALDGLLDRRLAEWERHRAVLPDTARADTAATR